MQVVSKLISIVLNWLFWPNNCFMFVEYYMIVREEELFLNLFISWVYCLKNTVLNAWVDCFVWMIIVLLNQRWEPCLLHFVGLPERRDCFIICYTVKRDCLITWKKGSFYYLLFSWKRLFTTIVCIHIEGKKREKGLDTQINEAQVDCWSSNSVKENHDLVRRIMWVIV